jgi:Mn2+/Fe2+ NRAMP family transporter
MLLAGDRALLGPLTSGRVLLAIGWLATAVLVLLSLTLSVSSLGGS